MSYDVGTAIPAPFLTRINQGFGDVNLDKATNSTDALVILSYELGFSVPYPIGKAFCPILKSRANENPKAIAKSGEKVKVWASAVADKFDPNVFDLPILVDMQASGEMLGSFTAKINWNPQVYELLGFKGGETNGFENPIVNDSQKGMGELIFANANPQGSKSMVNILNLRFRKINEAKPSDFQINFSSLAGSRSFADLMPELKIKAELNNPMENNLLVYPNPAPQLTNVLYQLNLDAQVEIAVYNSLGQLVSTLVNERSDRGSHSLLWDTRQSGLKPGLYILKMKTGTFTQERKVIIMR